MKRILFLALTLAASGPLPAASWETTSFRTAQGGLVRVGMTSADALHEMGPGARRHKGGSGRRGGETWSYTGSDGIYQITVSGGQVTRIVVIPARD
jgi:hypothetical protein